MRSKTLFWQIFPSGLAITVLALVAVMWYAGVSIRQFYRHHTESNLALRARLIHEPLRGLFSVDRKADAQARCRRLSAGMSTRITIVLPSGQVIGDSEEDPSVMDNHADRPEIKQALQEGVGSSIRFSRTLQCDMMYMALAVRENKRTVGVVRTAVSLDFIDRTLQSIYTRILVVGLAAAVLAAILSLIVSRRISRPLEELREGAEWFSQGDLSHPLAIPDSPEIGALAHSLNHMAAQLDERIRTVMRHRNELDTVLANMVEGVLAVDVEGRVISVNVAAGRLLEVDPDRARQKPLQEVTRNVALQEIVHHALQSVGPVEDEFADHNNGDKRFHAHASRLQDADGQTLGVLIVLNDLTQLRRLETIRRDFVANVSHELKTPITSIKGFVETLLSGAMENPEERTKFLNIIARQTERLHHIIEDLLLLSQIEEGGERERIRLQTHAAILPVLEAAALACERAAAKNRIEIRLDCPEDLKGNIDPDLMEQSIINLLDNAIKYSEPGDNVRIEVESGDEEIAIAVIDQGCGIPSEHLPRLFERFYRVDKARSRKLGGTGLGLSIVKHIAEAHGGRVTVQSKLGKGSVFTIHLPEK